MSRVIATVAAGALATVVLAACSGGVESGAGSVAPPASVGSTPTDATLAVGSTARVSYELASRSHDTTTLAMTVESVEQGKAIGLGHRALGGQSKVGVPFYVTASFRNVGNKAMRPRGIFGTIDVLDASGDKIPSITLLGSFGKCEGLPPDSLAPGKSFTQCGVYIAPAGQAVKSIVYDHFVGQDETKITWKV